MFRFMAFIWDVSSPQQSDAVETLSRRLLALSSQWREVVNGKGLKVFHTGARSGSLECHALTNNSGVVLGTLFERNRDHDDDTPVRKIILGEQQSREILLSHGQWLITSCWGNYVALITDATSKKKRVIKDPIGDLPCFSTIFQGVAIFFSNIQDCVALGLQFSVNKSYLDAYVVTSGNQNHDALNEVSRIYRGECVEVDTTSGPVIMTRRFYWTPLSFERSNDLIEDPLQAARKMRATVRSCIHSWASCHESLLLRLSGGLDSSIVVGCLKDAPTKPRIACYTYYNPTGRSDERPWARLAAEHAGCELTEYPITPADLPLSESIHMPPAVEPTSALGYLQGAHLEKRLTTERGATAVFSGDGGDSGFCSGSLVHAIPEYLHLHGLRPEILSLISHVALLIELSAWTLFVRSLRKWLLGSGIDDQKQAMLKASKLVDQSLVNAHAGNRTYIHPWFRSAERVPGGMLRRLGMLTTTPDFYNVSDGADSRAHEVVSPLYSQPVTELFLRIPIHVHFDGRDRGLARRAFVREVPQPILQRLWKDRAPGFHDELVQLNLNFLRELFLDGVLVKKGLLNRVAIEAALSRTPGKNDVFPGEILNHVGTEIWARHWMKT